MRFIVALFSSLIIFTILVELIAPSSSKEEIKAVKQIEKIPEKTIDEELNDLEEFFGIKEVVEKVEEPKVETKVEELKSEIWLPKIINIFQNSNIGFLFFYLALFITLFLQIYYLLAQTPISFVAVDFNLQAPPMLGVGGTIYALVNTQIGDDAIKTLTTVLLGAGLTTLLGVSIFVINHYLSRYIKTK
jgi:hypothetical protein